MQSLLRHLGTALLLTSTFVGCSDASAVSAPASLTRKWVADTNLAAPESVYYDDASKQLFVSNVNGNAADKDGNGWIATVTVDKGGKVVVTKIVEGLDAPKGLVAHNGVLWVTDIDQVVSIDIKSHKILAKIPVEGATFLNDPAVGADGTLYLSDTIASRIYAVKDGKSSLFAEGESLESPNGLLVLGQKLVVASWGLITDPATFGAKTPGHLYALDLKTKAKTLITPAPLGNLDGLVRAKNGDFLVSDWVAGKVYRVNARGVATLLGDGFQNAADIGLEGSLLLVPEMGGNKVTALKL